MKLTKQLFAKIVLGIVAVAMVATFALVNLNPTVVSAASTPAAAKTYHHKAGAKKAPHHKIHRAFNHGWAKGTLDAAAGALKVTSDQLKADLKAGKSIADVATAQNVDLQTVKTAILGAIKTDLDAAVKAGKLTQDKANTIYNNASSRVDKMVNAKFTGHKAKSTSTANQ